MRNGAIERPTERPTEGARPAGHAPSHSRRDFLAAAATAATAGGGVASLLNAQPAPAARGGAPAYGPYPAVGMAADAPADPHRRMPFQRRALGPKDVAIRIHYCGVCHSDIHTIRGDWGPVQYPQIVGHELAGTVVAVGSSVSRFIPGARVGVGTTVDSCRRCAECHAGHENYCLNGNTQTYGSRDRDGTITQGGYSTFVVVDGDFVLRVPDAMDLADAGPLLCAGVTVYSPLRRWGVSPGQQVAVVGMGGLGHLAVKLAAALGAGVTVFTTSPDKAADANGVRQMALVMYRNAIAGSNTGNLRETQDPLDFCARHRIRPEVTRIAMTGIDDAWAKVVAKQARYRFVIDTGA